jgi:hypothetical protein
MEALLRNLRFGARMLGRNPGFTAATVLSYLPARRATKVDPAEALK